MKFLKEPSSEFWGPRRIFKDIVVDFEVKIPFEIIDLKIKQLNIAPYKIYGVIPLEQYDDGSYRCCVDYFEMTND